MLFLRQISGESQVFIILRVYNLVMNWALLSPAIQGHDLADICAALLLSSALWAALNALAPLMPAAAGIRSAALFAGLWLRRGRVAAAA
jgi:hypothetical protein